MMDNSKDNAWAQGPLNGFGEPNPGDTPAWADPNQAVQQNPAQNAQPTPQSGPYGTPPQNAAYAQSGYPEQPPSYGAPQQAPPYSQGAYPGQQNAPYPNQPQYPAYGQNTYPGAPQQNAPYAAPQQSASYGQGYPGSQSAPYGAPPQAAPYGGQTAYSGQPYRPVYPRQGTPTRKKFKAPVVIVVTLVVVLLLGATAYFGFFFNGGLFTGEEGKITAVFNDYSAALKAGNIDKMNACVVPEMRATSGESDLIASLGGSMMTLEPLTNIQISSDKNTATGESKTSVDFLGLGSQMTFSVSFRKQDGKWLIADMAPTGGYDDLLGGLFGGSGDYGDYSSEFDDILGGLYDSFGDSEGLDDFLGGLFGSSSDPYDLYGDSYDSGRLSA